MNLYFMLNIQKFKTGSRHSLEPYILKAFRFLKDFFFQKNGMSDITFHSKNIVPCPPKAFRLITKNQNIWLDISQSLVHWRFPSHKALALSYSAIC